jgi:hypothetical protein
MQLTQNRQIGSVQNANVCALFAAALRPGFYSGALDFFSGI